MVAYQLWARVSGIMILSNAKNEWTVDRDLEFAVYRTVIIAVSSVGSLTVTGIVFSAEMQIKL